MEVFPKLVGKILSPGLDLRPHSIILASSKPGCKPRRRLAWACRKHVESRSKAICKLASNLLQTKSMLAAMKKPKHSTWVKQYIRTDTDMIQNESQWYELIRAVISGWTSVNSVSHNACSLWNPIYNVFGCKIKLFHSVFSLNYVMISTNNKIRNENPASTGSFAASNGCFFTFHLSSTRTNQRTCCINFDMSRLMQQVRDQVFDNKSRKRVANPHELVENLVANLVENQVFDQYIAIHQNFIKWQVKRCNFNCVNSYKVYHQFCVILFVLEFVALC